MKNKGLKHKLRFMPALLFMSALLLFAGGLITPVRSLANGPIPMSFFAVKVENAPENTYALDFLMPEDKIPEEQYTECNETALAEAGFAPDCGLAKLDADGYVSYLVHSKESEFDGLLSDVPFYSFSDTSSADNADTANADAAETDSANAGAPQEETGHTLYSLEFNSGYHEMVRGASPTVRIALLDKEGNVLCISDAFAVRPSRPNADYSSVRYDAATGEAYLIRLHSEPGEPDHYYSFADHVFMMIFAFLILGVVGLITMLVEFIIALIFRLKPAPWTLLVNFFSNCIFNLLIVIFCFAIEKSLPYGPFIIVGEIVVVLVEYLLYTGIYKNYSRRRLLIYSIVANAFSAVLVLLITSML